MQSLIILVLAALFYVAPGRAVDCSQGDISHLQDEVNFLKANLSAVWEKLHEDDIRDGAVSAEEEEDHPVKSVVRETRNHRVNLDFYLDIPDHPTPHKAEENHAVQTPDDHEMHYAHCEMEPNTHLVSYLHHKVHGSIHMVQEGHGAVHMEVMLTGFNTSEDFASHHHGLHMHEYGDLSEGCGSVGELYHNEHAPDHANPGDLGDVVDDMNGNVNANLTFDWFQIGLADGILGRSLVILQGDHNQEQSEQIACCIIGRASVSDHH
ncbi:extracellular superoxide dismutase [Cu-Zn] [Ostrea edulis]|uniref:extracellular superoxide dismutase [Cu-Zn] n=1 Tax=Ostrea edulis TaxID=37623 RepID=UPI002094BC20|nr:extracellular superoxide dismutase [Cu-Zn] [Ostrea edulis]